MAREAAWFWLVLAIGSLVASIVTHIDLMPATFGCLAVSNIWFAANWLAEQLTETVSDPLLRRVG
jgi:membrane protein implicated in regulation of membrane protease activity